MLPQLMPVGELVTVPEPVPDFVTDRASLMRAKPAATEAALLSVTLHVPVPLQPPPLHPVKVDPEAGAAVRVTAVP